MLKQLRDAWFNMLSGASANVPAGQWAAGELVHPGMSAETELLRAYREWHRLAQAETKAIQTRNWALLTDCHLAIKDFQLMVGKLTQETREEWRRTGCNLAEKEKTCACSSPS